MAMPIVLFTGPWLKIFWHQRNYSCVSFCIEIIQVGLKASIIYSNTCFPGDIDVSLRLAFHKNYQTTDLLTKHF